MRPGRRWWALLCVIVAAGYVYMLAPITIVVLEAFNASELMRFPPREWSVRWFRELARHDDFVASFGVSLELAAVSAVIATLAGTLAAYALVRDRRARQTPVETLLLAPLYVPRVLLGMALLLTLSKLWLSGSFTGMAIGHVLITMPFVVRSVTAALHGVDPAVEEAARVLGASWTQALLRVTLPLARSGVIAGLIFAFIVSFSDVYLALFISGPQTITLPLRIFNFMEWEQTPLVAAVSTAQIALVLLVILVAEKAVGLSGVGRI